MDIKFITTEEYLHLLGLIESMKKSIDSLSTKSNDFDFLNTQQVCIMLSISKRCLQNYTCSGVIKSTKLGGLNYYSKSEINNLLKKNLK